MASALRDQQKLKNLRSQLVVVEEELEALKNDIKVKQQEFEKKKLRIESLKKEISEYINPTEIQISEHAMVRYFERVKGFDLEKIKGEIITEYLKNLIDKMGGSGKYINAVDGKYKIVMKKNVVVTIEN